MEDPFYRQETKSRGSAKVKSEVGEIEPDPRSCFGQGSTRALDQDLERVGEGQLSAFRIFLEPALS